MSVTLDAIEQHHSVSAASEHFLSFTQEVTIKTCHNVLIQQQQILYQI